MINKKLVERAEKVKHLRVGWKWNTYLELPDAKDSRWGLSGLGGCVPITEKRAEKIIEKLEKKLTRKAAK